MECVQEYINLFESNKALIDKPCTRKLNEEREKAFVRFRAEGFPKFKDENWLHTNVAKKFETDYGMDLGRRAGANSVKGSFTCDVPNLKTVRGYIVNDCFTITEEDRNKLPKGVLIGKINEIAESNPEIIDSFYNQLASKGDSIVQFNTSFVQDGIILYVPKNTVIDETIQIVAQLQTNVDILTNRRLLVVMEENSHASLLLCDHSSTDKKSLSIEVTEIFIGRGASLDLYELEETTESNTRLGNLFVNQKHDSRFNHCNITLTNGFTRNYIEVALDGEGADTNINGLAIGDKKQHIDNRTLVEHKKGHCTSNELYKYILDEESIGVFAGKMLICTDAQQTVSQQTNRNLCLTSCARMYAQPQLEIYADDVKCSHGSTVGQLDENALFYMQQRGIPADEARHLLMYAFAGEVIDNIKLEALRERLHILVEKRFRGELNHCKGCNLCK
ncbi:MAG: Fe-S cluster assembly protein SufD [Bacteroidaceae bacterium]|nr:Fe-S cluster assembly protein SufD [Bacteroidaceae bacterium]